MVQCSTNHNGTVLVQYWYSLVVRVYVLESSLTALVALVPGVEFLSRRDGARGGEAVVNRGDGVACGGGGCPVLNTASHVASDLLGSAETTVD